MAQTTTRSIMSCWLGWSSRNTFLAWRQAFRCAAERLRVAITPPFPHGGTSLALSELENARSAFRDFTSLENCGYSNSNLQDVGEGVKGIMRKEASRQVVGGHLPVVSLM